MLPISSAPSSTLLPSSPSLSQYHSFNSLIPSEVLEEGPRHEGLSRTGTIPKARPSTLSRTSRHQHHHRNRPSRHLIAPTSNAIFGNWDIQVKSEHRANARTKARVGVSGGGGGRGGTMSLGPGPGVSMGATGNIPGGHTTSLPLSSAPEVQYSSSSTIGKGPRPLTSSTPWSLGQQKNNSKPNARRSLPVPSASPESSIPSSTPTTPTHSTASSSTPTVSDKTLSKKKSAHHPADETTAHAMVPFSARASFLRALGKFKNKHTQQKRSSVPIPVVNVAQSTSGPSTTTSPFLLPPMTFGSSSTENVHHTGPVDQATSPAWEITPTEPEPTPATHPTPLHDPEMDMDMDEPESLASPLPSPTEDRISANSSLRLKFKNRMSHTLASIKSSSNLKDKAKSQPTTTSTSTWAISSQSENGPATSSSSDPAHGSKEDSNAASGKSNRQSKTFWTFPRVRLDQNQPSKQLPWGPSKRPSSMSVQPAAQDQDQDTDMTSPATAPEEDVQNLQVQDANGEELDSDNSIDIITMADYEDYTQFAELPLKKRKRMEAAAAAAMADPSMKRPSSMRSSADAMKKFLKHQKQDQENAKKGEVIVQSTQPTLSNSSDGNNHSNSKKKRIVDPAESTKPAGKTGKQEWRQSLLKTLHLGKGQSSRKADKAALQAAKANASSTLAQPKEGQSTVAVSTQQESPLQQRLGRSDTVQSIRSRSMATSAHPGLMATTIAKPRGQGLRRETLEMAMRRRRQSSAARSNISDTEVPPPLPSSSLYFGIDNASTTNITHTFTSFTLELAEMYAQDVMNNSATPGLFNFKRRQTRLTMSSNILEPDTDQEFKGFDSDGDAISGYTGDADVSMEEIFVRPKTPASPPPSGRGKGRESNTMDILSRRKISSVDGDSDTLPELPTLVIRTRDLNRSSGGGRGSYSRTSRPVSSSSFDQIEEDADGMENPRSPRRGAGANSPTLTRKTSRQAMGTSGSSNPHRAASPKNSPGKALMSMEDIVSWKPRNMHSTRPAVPSLDTKPLRASKGSGLSSSTTLIPSARTPYSGYISQSPSVISPGDRGLFPHSQHLNISHQQQLSGDTLTPQHLKNFSTASTLSARSGYSAQTVTGHGQGDGSMSFQSVAEFDPSQEFPPTTPVDLKAMDFEALLATAEREHQKGWEDLKAQKKSTTFQPQNQQPLKIASNGSSRKGGILTENGNSSSGYNRGHQSSGGADEIVTVTSRSIPSTGNNNHSSMERTLHGSVAFNLGSADDGTGTGTGTGSDRSMRSKRVMKKKMSVIRLTGNGNVQGRREDDGVIRVSMSSSGEQWR